MTLLRPGAQTMLSLTWRLALVLVTGAMLVEVLRLDPTELRPLAAGVQSRRPEPLDVPPATPPPDKTSYPAIAARPLFYPSRAPWVPPAPPPEEPPPPPTLPLTDYALVGVIVSGTSRSALIRQMREGRTVLLSEGQELEGWKLREITRERLYFTGGDATYEMPLLKPSETQR